MTVYADYMKDRTGWFFGLTGVQLTLLAVAAAPVWLALNAGRFAWLLLWVPVWIVIAGLIVIPVRGWTAAQWLGVLLAHAMGGVMGWTQWRSRAATGRLEDLDDADLPGALAALQIHDGPPFGPGMARIAVIQNHAARTWAVTARIEHPGLGLAEPDARDRMGAGLAELCEAATRTEVVKAITLQVRTVPDDGAERAEWVRTHRHPSAPELAGRINTALAEQLMPAAMRTESFVTVVIADDRIARTAKRGGRGVAARAQVLYGALTEVEAILLGPLGCTQVDWLDSPSLAAAIRCAFEPGDRTVLATAHLAHRNDPRVATSVPVAGAGPAVARTALRSYRHGDWVSMTDTILLPQQGAVLGALAPVLVPSAPEERRSLTVVLSPVSARAADKMTSREELSAITAAELRRRTGRMERARDRQSVRQVKVTDEKLARGRSLVRVSAALSITVPADWAVTDYGRRLDASVRLAGYVPQRLDGAQDAGFAVSTVPVGLTLSGNQR